MPDCEEMVLNKGLLNCGHDDDDDDDDDSSDEGLKAATCLIKNSRGRHDNDNFIIKALPGYCTWESTVMLFPSYKALPGCSWESNAIQLLCHLSWFMLMFRSFHVIPHQSYE